MKSYTFHVSLPGHGRVWRKLELPAEATLEDLHFSIQNAYDFDADHLYSFFMSGKAWDTATEYSLPDGADPWGGELEFAGADETADAEPATDQDEIAPDEMPTGQDLRTMLTTLKAQPELRDQFVQQITQRVGLPQAAVETMLNNVEVLLQDASDEEVDAMFSMMSEGDEEEANDVRTVTLEELSLRKGKKFLYLFDYGDEWRFQVRVDAINNKADPNAQYPLIVESVGDAPPQYPDWDEEEEEEEE